MSPKSRRDRPPHGSSGWALRPVTSAAYALAEKVLSIDPLNRFGKLKQDAQYSSFLSAFYAMVGDNDKACDWLEHAVDRGFINYPFLNTHDPFLGSLRGEERFKNLMERVKYEWEHFEV